MHETIIATIPQRDTDTVLEVALIRDAYEGTRIALRYLVWSPGLGWYRQQTLTLDPSAARALLRALGHVRSCLGNIVGSGQERKVIPLPGSGHTHLRERCPSPVALEAAAYGTGEPIRRPLSSTTVAEPST
jgi:hypothetical protein